MKKLKYLLALFFALTLMSFSCSKNDDDPIVPQTLEEKYPDWKNLRWVSTDGVTAQMNPDIYPRLEISISGDEGEITHTINSVDYFWDSFSTMTISGNTVNFGSPANTTGTFTKSGSQITLTTKGLTITSHTYVLQIN